MLARLPEWAAWKPRGKHRESRYRHGGQRSTFSSFGGVMNHLSTRLTTTARRLRRIGVALAALILLGTALPGTASAYPTDLGPGDPIPCNTIDHPDGRTWTRSPVGGGGSATFYERGEYLKVKDTNSNGWRVVAQITWCDGPFWTVSPLRGWLDRDSGPNEGAVDRETYDFDFAEGRRLVFRVCEKKISTGAIRNCSGNEMVWA
jgi:hypothetical protein